MTNYTNEQVKTVSDFLQKYMRQKNLQFMSADECALLLANNNVLPNNIGPKLGFNFRQMLRDGRDNLVDKVTGSEQIRPHTKWIINRISI